MVSDELLELLDDFLLECDERVATVETMLLAVEAAPRAERQEMLDRVRRELHTLKGNSGMMGLADLQKLAHEMEDAVDGLDPDAPSLEVLFADLDAFKSGIDALRPEQSDSAAGPHAEAPRDASIRVPTAELDRLLDLAAEMLAARHRLADAVSTGSSAAPGDGADAWREVEEQRRRLDKTAALLDDRLRRLRMVPLKGIFTRLQRVVRDESAKGGKLVRLVTRGELTPLDAALVELAGDTLGHLVRNAVVHGMQTPDERAAAGKPERGTILVEAAIRGQRVEIEVLDDGTGIDRERLREVASRNGFAVPADANLHTLVFHPGLSTRQTVDSSSGRGIGTAAVLDAVHRYSGTIEVDSKGGIGTRFCLQLPLTVAVTDALLVEANRQRYALPVTSVVETVAAPATRLQRTAEGQTFLDRSGFSLPIIDLARFFSPSRAPSADGYAVIISSEGKLRGLLVERLGAISNIVVTPLDSALGRPPGIAGTTVTGSGDVLLILDPPALMAGLEGAAA